jgi:DNA topoisomerase-1
MLVSAASEVFEISKSDIKTAVADLVKSAKVVNLVYVNDASPGITRERNNGNFIYLNGKKRIRDKSVLERIQKLAIPPAWEKVWICENENGHLQATGLDARGRKQYRYHALWNSIRNTTKFYRMLDFGRQLPLMRRELKRHLALPGYPKEKILALVVSLLEQTKIRIGNGFYEKLYGSFGLTTLKNDHVKVKGAEMIFNFKGKKGIEHKISLKSKRLASLVQGCKDIPGKDLFEFIDEEGNIQQIDSGMVNNYIHSLSGTDFSAKDFRTWAGSTEALLGFAEAGDFGTASEMKEKTLQVLDRVAKALGNTRTVCRKYYVHPLIISLYEEKKLLPNLRAIREPLKNDEGDLGPEEQLLIKILEKN